MAVACFWKPGPQGWVGGAFGIGWTGVKDACGQVFRYGIAIGACQRNPATDLRDALKPVQSRHHAAIWTLCRPASCCAT
jgi:hypothetical protein